ncbi:MAG: glycosyltransferase [Thiovulaceae bacterium]|nr:glycosyltransferase [Sulfurimonadaceae bacterium]
MSNPKVSVLIPAYNYGHYISEAIESVLNQTYQDFELIVVDNNSEDNTVELVSEYMKKDSRVSIHVNLENIGMYRNYNQALALASGDYIKFLNADDKFEPTLLEKFVNILNKNESVSLVSSKRQYFGDKTDILEAGFVGEQNKETVLAKAFKDGNIIGEPTTVMFRKKHLNVGTFNIDLKMFADFDMWIKLLEVGNVYFVDEVLSYFRIHETQGTKYLNNEIKKSYINKFQFYNYMVNKLLFNDFFDYKITKKLLKLNINRTAKIVGKSAKYINKFKTLYAFGTYLKYLRGRLK